MCFERTSTQDEEAARSRRRLWDRLSPEQDEGHRTVQVVESDDAEPEPDTVREKVPVEA